MGGEEKPPARNGEQKNVAVMERPEHEAGTSSGAQQAEDELREMLRRFRDTVHDIEINALGNNQAVSEKDDDLELRGALSKVARDAKRDDGRKKYEFLPEVTRDILRSSVIDTNITVRNSPLIYTLLEGSVNHNLDTDLTALKNVTRKIYNLRTLDLDLAKTILKPLRDKLEGGGLKDDPLFEKVSSFLVGKKAGKQAGLSWDDAPTLTDLLARTGGEMPNFNPNDLSTLPETLRDLSDVIRQLGTREQRPFNIDDPSTWGTEDWYEIAMVREYFKTREDKELWSSIIDVERFGEYVEGKRRATLRSHSGKSKEEIRKIVSEEINFDVEWLFSRLYSRLDRTKPDKFFDELEREGYSNSMESAKAIFISRLDGLGSRLLEADYERWKNFFYRDRMVTNVNLKEEEKEIEFRRDKKAKLEKKRVRRVIVESDQVLPIPVAQQCNAKEFTDGLLVRVRAIESATKYSHDVIAAYNIRAGEKGFWPQIAEFSQKYHMGDMDELVHLSNGWLYFEAHNLIRKYFEAELAKINWNLGTQTLAVVQGEFLNRIQLKVKEDLIKMYRQVFGRNEREWAMNEWKARRLVNLAWGLARGATLSEPEIAAWADPGLDSNGHPTHYSIGTNESDPYVAFNPQMRFNRWAHDEHKRQALLWSVVNFYKKRWDHLEGFKEMRKFFDAWWGGEMVIDRANPDERRLYEFFSDMQRVGSLGFRGAWRNKSFEYWLVGQPGVKDQLMDEEGNILLPGTVNLLESWKALENIGYDITYLFTEAAVVSDWEFLISTENKHPEKYSAKQELLKYLYENHIQDPEYPQTTGRSFPEYLSMIRKKAEAIVEDKIKRKDLEKVAKADHVEAEITRLIVYRGLAGMLLERVPTKLIKLERNRFSEQGERAWELVRGRMGWGDGDESVDRMDKALRNLGMVESLLRRQTSLKMREYLEPQIDDDVINKNKKVYLNRFLDDTHYEYKMTGDFIDQRLREMGSSETEIEDAKKVFKAIKRFVLDDKVEDRERLHKEPWEEILISRKNRFYGYTESFLDAFAGKLRKAETHGTIKEYKDLYFPFAMAPDEVDHFFINWLNAGQGAQTRALREVGESEMLVFKPLTEWWDALEVVARDPKRNLEPILKPLLTIKEALTSIHEEIYAHKVMDGLVSATIAYFRKDDLANVFPFNTTSWGSVNSIAAMMYGTNRGIWEWEPADIRNFVIECERMRVVPRRPWDFFSNPPDMVRKKFLGIIPYSVETYHPRFKYFSRRLLARAGGSGKDIVWTWVNKYLPIIALAILFQAIRNAVKQQTKGKSN